MKSIWGTFIKGFVTVIPLVITLYLIFWIVVSAEALVYSIFKIVLTDRLYVPGMGLAAAVVLLYMLGLLWEKQAVVRKLSDFAERQVKRIPVFKSFYVSIKNLMDFFTAAKEEDGALRKVVLVNLTDDIRLVGFVTGDAEDHLGFSSDDGEKILAVYLQLSYQMGGYLIYVPQSRVTPIDMGFEEATQLLLTAGMGQKKPPHVER